MRDPGGNDEVSSARLRHAAPSAAPEARARARRPPGRRRRGRAPVPRRAPRAAGSSASTRSSCCPASSSPRCCSSRRATAVASRSARSGRAAPGDCSPRSAAFWRRSRSTRRCSPSRTSSRRSEATRSRPSATSRTGGRLRRAATTGRCSEAPRRSTTRGASRSRSSSIWCGRCWSRPSSAVAEARIAARRILVVSVALALASFAWMLVIFDPADPSRVYFGTDTRIASILIGAALAAWLSHAGAGARRRRPRRARDRRACVALAILAITWIARLGFVEHAVPRRAVRRARSQPLW